MILPRGDALLLPANPLFVWLTLVLAFLLNLVPLGRMPAMPDFLAVVLVFWNVHQSRRVGIGIAFLFGLAMDVHDAAVLGQHALAYTLLAFFATTIHRRLLWFTVPSQAVQIHSCARRGRRKSVHPHRPRCRRATGRHPTQAAHRVSGFGVRRAGL